jgi:pyruvate/2-oxoglutarate dehydrogenase complex dihydrolipoamide acyltransferase (E2) component
MAVEIRIPGLGAGMQEGTLVQWHLDQGATVNEGDLLYTLESEKTSQDIEAQESGTLNRIGIEGEVYPVGQLIGVIN